MIYAEFMVDPETAIAFMPDDTRSIHIKGPDPARNLHVYELALMRIQARSSFTTRNS